MAGTAAQNDPRTVNGGNSYGLFEILHEKPDLADEFDSLFDFFLLDELSPRDDAEGRCTFSLPGMAFARDGSGGEYHLLEDGSIGYYSSEGEAGRLAESMDDLFFPACELYLLARLL